MGLGIAYLLNQIENVNSPSTALSLLKKCEAAQKQGQAQEAKRLILLAERQAIKSPLVHKQFGHLYSKMNMNEKALAHYNHFLKLQPDANDHKKIKSLILHLQNQLKKTKP